MQEFLGQIRAAHDESAHGSQFLLCSEMPGVRTLEVNFFSVSNTEDFKNGAKPRVQEMSTVVFK